MLLSGQVALEPVSAGVIGWLGHRRVLPQPPGAKRTRVQGDEEAVVVDGNRDSGTPPESVLESREVHYQGRVQGVGFRFTVRLIAARFAVCGFVKNLPDGRVQLVAEGESNELQRFLATVSAEMGRYIRDTQQRTTSASGRFNTFEVRF